jgi:acetyl esterase/lipase
VWPTRGSPWREETVELEAWQAEPTDTEKGTRAMSIIDDALSANATIANDYDAARGKPPAPKIAIVTCADPRLRNIEQMLGLAEADVDGCASMSGLPPLLVQVGTADLLLSDSERLAAAAGEAGVDVTLEIGEGLPHVFPLLLGTPEAAAATEQIGQFLRARVR